MKIAGNPSKKFDFLKDYSELFEKVKDVFLATDNDGPGWFRYKSILPLTISVRVCWIMYVYMCFLFLQTHIYTPAGEALAEELARRIGKHKCYRVRWPDGIKDANDMLRKHGPQSLEKCIKEAEEYPVEGLQRYTRRTMEASDACSSCSQAFACDCVADFINSGRRWTPFSKPK